MTHKELRRLIRLQFEHTAGMMEGTHWETSDDGWDYLQGALAFSRQLMHIDYCDKETDIYPALLKELPFSRSYACDGICPALYEWETVKHLREAVEDGTEDDKAEMEEYIQDVKIPSDEAMARRDRLTAKAEG